MCRFCAVLSSRTLALNGTWLAALACIGLAAASFARAAERVSLVQGGPAPLAAERGVDCNSNGIPDDQETDCNSNGTPDDCDIAAGTSQDCDLNGIPDDCEASTSKAYSANPALAIPDDDPVGIDSVITVPESGLVADLNVALQIDHTWQGDVTVTLTHNATTVVLLERVGSRHVFCSNNAAGYSANNFGAAGNPLILDDSAGPPINCYDGGSPVGIADYSGPARPAEPLVAFNGMDKAGPWTLTVSDAAAADTGVLNFWSLELRNAGGVDCNINGIPDACELVDNDCNTNGALDECDIATGLSEDCQVNGIPDECDGGCTGGTVLSAVSRKACDLNVSLVPGVLSTEPRQGGISVLLVEYTGGPPPSALVLLADDPTCPGPASYAPYAGGAAMNCISGASTLACTLTPGLENARTYRFTVRSGAGTADIEIRGLIGDVDGNGLVNAVDRSTVVGAWTGPGFTCETDVTNDGTTNALDRSVVVGAWTNPLANCAP